MQYADDLAVLAIDHGLWLHWGVNPGPFARKADMLTTTLWIRVLFFYSIKNYF